MANSNINIGCIKTVANNGTSKLPSTGEWVCRNFWWTINSSDSWDWLCNAASKHFNRALLAITLAPLEPKRRRSAQMAFKPTSCGICRAARNCRRWKVKPTKKKQHISINKKDEFSPIQSNLGAFCLFFLAKNPELHHSPSPPATGEQRQTSSVHTLLTQRSIGKIHQKSSQKEYLAVDLQLWKISKCSTVAMEILPHIRILGDDHPQSTP